MRNYVAIPRVHELKFSKQSNMQLNTCAYHSDSPACEVDSICHLSLQVVSSDVLASVDTVQQVITKQSALLQLVD